MNIRTCLTAIVLSTLAVACGGGGGSAGTSVFGSGSGTTTGTTTTTDAYTVSVEVDRASAATTQVSSTETVQAVATVTANGAPVEGVVVTFSETGGSLLTFAPTSATALTDTSGKASIDIKAASSSGTGATTVKASASVGTTAYTGTKSLSITAGAGAVVTPAAINFVSSVPSATAIVIKGAGGNGRSESAFLTFKVVDATNTPVSAATVDFTINADNGGATINQQSSVSDSSGLVTVSVTSGTQPASIVVTAASHTVPSVTSQSDTLLVSNGVAEATAFELVAAKYNLDGLLTGDTTTITAHVADANGNPVPDGVAVSFQTDLGVVGSSTLGGCVTANGACTVTYAVQNPRGNGLATVVGTVRVGSSGTLVDSLSLHLAGVGSNSYVATSGGSTLTQLTLSSCKQTFELQLTDGVGRAPAAGTVIAVPVTSTGLVATVAAGTPVLDQLDAGGFPPSTFDVTVDLSGTTVAPACNATSGAVSTAQSYFNLTFTTPGGRTFGPQRVLVAYPH